MSQTSVNVIAGDDARASDFNKVVADIAEIYAGGPGVPVGGIIYWWSDNTVPLNYKVCDGTVVSDIASPLNALTLPNLTDRFIRGVANSNIRSTPISGGADTHVLTVEELPSHNHNASQSPHSHGVYDPGHNHSLNGRNASYPGGAGGASDGSGVEWVASIETRGGGVNPSGSNIGIYGANANIVVESQGGGQAHNNMPSYRGMVPIMRIK